MNTAQVLEETVTEATKPQTPLVSNGRNNGTPDPDTEGALTKSELIHYKALLDATVREQEDIIQCARKKISNVQASLDRGHNDNAADRGGDITTKREANRELDRANKALKLLYLGLEKFRLGTYGICFKCTKYPNGHQIRRARLEYNPGSTVCCSAAKKFSAQS